MNQAQNRTVEEIKNKATKLVEANPCYEIKKLEIQEDVITPTKTYVSVNFVYGLKNDEGTLASVFARDSFLLSIGYKGGIRVLSKNGYLSEFHNIFRRPSIFNSINKIKPKKETK